MDAQTDAIVVVGSHRSGTSLVASLLHAAGASMGDEMLGAMPSNPHGHYEDAAVVAFHERIFTNTDANWLTAAGATIDLNDQDRAWMARYVAERQATGTPWGFKDPRTAAFIEHWSGHLPGARYVLVFRDPGYAARSTEERTFKRIIGGYGTAVDEKIWHEPDTALIAWIEHNERLLSFVDDHPDQTVLVSVDDLGATDHGLIAALRHRWPVDLEPTPDMAVFEPSSLSESPMPFLVHDAELRVRAEALYRRLHGHTNRLWPTDNYAAAHLAPANPATVWRHYRMAQLEEASRQSELAPHVAEATETPSGPSAESDLRWLIRRLDEGVAGPVVRRFAGFRTLRDRWL